MMSSGGARSSPSGRRSLLLRGNRGVGAGGRPRQAYWTESGTEELGEKLGKCLMELSQLKMEHATALKEKEDAAKAAYQYKVNYQRLKGALEKKKLDEDVKLMVVSLTEALGQRERELDAERTRGRELSAKLEATKKG